MWYVGVPDTGPELVLWGHACVIWMLVNYGHQMDPLGQDQVRAVAVSARKRWRIRVALRAIAGGLVLFLLVGHTDGAVGLAALFLVLAVLLPLVRLHSATAESPASWHDLRGESELTGNVLFLAGSALWIGSFQLDLSLAVLEVPTNHAALADGLLVGSGAVFLLRGGTHVIRGILEKSDTLLTNRASYDADDRLRHGITIGNIERLLIYVFALIGSYAAIGLVLTAKGVVRAVEWKDRPTVEYFLIGTLASAGLATVVGIVVRGVLQLG